MNEARLRIVDKYLHKGWCSYLDIALAINDAIVSYKGDSLEQFGLMKFEPGKRSYNSSCSFNKQLVDELRSSIGQDFMDIPEIWALPNEAEMRKIIDMIWLNKTFDLIPGGLYWTSDFDGRYTTYLSYNGQGGVSNKSGSSNPNQMAHVVPISCFK